MSPARPPATLTPGPSRPCAVSTGARGARRLGALAAAALLGAAALTACTPHEPPQQSTTSTPVSPTSSSTDTAPPTSDSVAPASTSTGLGPAEDPSAAQSKIPWPPETTTPGSPAPVEPRWTVPNSTTIGACVLFDYTKSIDQAGLGVVPCAQEHDAQVVGFGTLPDDFQRTKTGFNAVLSKQCDPAFAEYTGTRYNNSRLNLTGWMANAKEFEAGDRTLVCIVTMLDHTRFTGDAHGKSDESEFGHEDSWKSPSNSELGISGTKGQGQGA